MFKILKNKKRFISIILVISFIISSITFKKEETVMASTSSDNYLSINDIIDISEPAINGTNPVSSHILYLTKDGYVYGKGKNTWGQLGQGHTNTVNGLVKIKDNGEFKNGTVKSIQTGEDFSMLLTEDGKVYGFGRSSAAELGFYSADPVILPREVSLENLGGSPVKKIIASGRVSTILSEDGNVYTAGLNSNATTMQATRDGSTQPHNLITNPWSGFNNGPFISGTHEVVNIFEGSNTIYFSTIHSTTRGTELSGLRNGEDYQGGGNLYDESNGTFLYAGGDNTTNLTGVNDPKVENYPNIKPRMLHHINIDSPIVDVAATRYSALFLTESGKLYRTRGASGSSGIIATPTLVPNRDRAGEDYKFINGETKIKKLVGGMLSGPNRSPLILAENGDLFAISAEWSIVRVRENVEDIFKGQRPFIKFKDGTLQKFDTVDFNNIITIDPTINIELKEDNLIDINSSASDLRNMFNISITGVGSGALGDYKIDFLGVDLNKAGRQSLEIRVTGIVGNPISKYYPITVVPESGVVEDISKTKVKTLGTGLRHNIALSNDGDVYVIGRDGTISYQPGGFGIPDPANQSQKGVQYLDTWTKVPLKAGDIIPPVNSGGEPGTLNKSILDDDEYIIQITAG